jgi:excinuclease UvrABC helicase subunit UvrB
LVIRGRRRYYYVLLPAGSRPVKQERVSHIVDHLRRQLAQREEEFEERHQVVRRQQQQIANLSRSLARALSQNGGSNGASPYQKYRSLVRRRRLWLLG